MTPARIAELRALRVAAEAVGMIRERAQDYKNAAGEALPEALDAIERVRALALAYGPESRYFHLAIGFLNAIDPPPVQHECKTPICDNPKRSPKASSDAIEPLEMSPFPLGQVDFISWLVRELRDPSR